MSVWFDWSVKLILKWLFKYVLSNAGKMRWKLDMSWNSGWSSNTLADEVYIDLLLSIWKYLLHYLSVGVDGASPFDQNYTHVKLKIWSVNFIN